MVNTEANSGAILPVGERHAVVIAPSPDLDLRGIGTVRACLERTALAAVASAAGVVAEGATLPARMAGRLVELDAQSVALLRQARQTVEAGGWVQGTLRVDGKYAHVARFRPAVALDLAAGIANIVGAVAAQAQLAAIHRDVVRTLHEVQKVSAFQHAELIGALQSDADDVRRWVTVMLDVGVSRRAIDAADRAGERLRARRAHCLNLAETAVGELEAAATRPTPLSVQRTLRDKTAWQTRQYLELAGAAHLAAVQAEALVVGELLSVGDPAAASHARALVTGAYAEQRRLVDLRRRAGKAGAAVAGTHGTLAMHFGRMMKRALGVGSAAAATAAVSATRVVAVTAVTAVPAAATRAAAAAAVGGLPATVVTAAGVGVVAKRQKNAEGALMPLLASLNSADQHLAAVFTRTNMLLATVADAAGLEAGVLERARRQAATPPPAAALIERVLEALTELDDWAHLAQIRRRCDATPSQLRAALDAAADDGKVLTRPSPTRTVAKTGAPQTQYRLAVA